MNLVTNHPSYFLEYFFLLFHIGTCLPNGVFPADFAIEPLYDFLLCSMRATRTAHLSLLYVISLIIFGQEYE